MQQLDFWLGGTVAPSPSTRSSRARREPAANTRLAYATDLRAFVAWCHERGEDARPPIPPATVAAYPRHLWETLERRQSTVERAMFAIGAAHDERGLPNPIHDPVVKSVWGGILAANVRGRERKVSLLTDAVREVLRVMQHETPRDDGEALRVVRDRAIILMLFAGALKRDELRTLELDRVGIDGAALRVVVAAGDRRPRIVQIVAGESDSPIPLRRSGSGCTSPTSARAPSSGQSTPRASSPTIPSDRRSLNRIIKKRCERAGLDPSTIATMSLRTGFVVEATRGGAAIDAIAEHTGHRGLGIRHIADLVAAGERLRENHPGRALGL